MTVAGRKTLGTRPRDASMSLLNNLFAQPLEPGYEQAAAKRRATDDGPGNGRRHRVSLALVVGMVALGLLLAVAALQAEGSASVVSAEREGLRERIEGQQAQAERMRATVASLQAEIAELEDRELQNTTAGQQLRDQLRFLQGVAGTVAVTGPGVSVVLDDAENPEAYEKPEEARVLDLDLQQVVNALWAAGAEAISINDERLTALTAIRMANNIIHVNQQPLSPPYVVSAIGDSRSLPRKFGEGPGGSHLWVAGDAGVQSSIRAEESLTLPAGSSALLYAENAKEAS